MSIEPKKSLGQHWLFDNTSLEAICREAELGSEDVVLEIGPGTGSLTAKLVKRAKKVLAVEADGELAAKLSKSLLNKNLEVINQDILKFDFERMPSGYKLVANIPYYLTNHLFRLLSETTNPPAHAVLLVQKEVAQRLAAAPGQMSTLAVAVQLKYQVKAGIIVTAKLFSPPPKVDSQTVILEKRGKPLFDIEEQTFFRLVKAGFSEKRKKLRSSLSGGLGISKPQAEQFLQQAGIGLELRAQSLSLEDWQKLYVAISPSL